MPELAILQHEDMLLHDTGSGHPEQPDRLRTVVTALQEAELAGARWMEAQPIDRASLELVHQPDYVTFIDSLQGRTMLLDDDTPVSPASVPAARLAAGAAIQAVDHVISYETDSAFALVRPPGHHAEKARAMGFCLFNNVAAAAAYALHNHALKRVLIIDWDVHHGNGTQHIFYDRDDVLFVDLHQNPFWPGTGGLLEFGEERGEGFTVNFPLPGGTGNEVYVGIFDSLIAPIARAYQPELILVSAGFDAHEDDPLGEMRVTADGFAAMCSITRNLARELCGGRIALLLEGGYGLRGLADSAVACARVLTTDIPEVTQGIEISTDSIINEFREYYRQFWPI
jgi:acetoin utilization deacetylase AcuC-like enzyme